MITHLEAQRSRNPDSSENIALAWKLEKPGSDLIVVDWEGDEDDGNAAIDGDAISYTIAGVDPEETYRITVGEYDLTGADAHLKSGPAAPTTQQEETHA